MDMEASVDLQIVMPVYNEADCVEAVIREIYNEIAPHLRIEFLVCEDGSRDGSREILRALSREVPMRLILGQERKGYTRALIDGLKASTADYVLCLESDGQYTPSDLWAFYDGREQYDVSIGWRKPRRDTFARRLMSACFGCLYRALFHSPVHDPSCAFMLIRRRVLGSVLGDMGLLMEGFQREFLVRVVTQRFRLREIPVHHRPRRSGGTKAFPLARIPGVALSNLAGLLGLWWQIRATPVESAGDAIEGAASQQHKVGVRHG